MSTPSRMETRLQWGHPCEGMENSTSAAAARENSQLQWGHPCEGMENEAEEKGAGKAQESFNGAIPVKGWKSGSSGCQVITRRASMGPSL